MFEAIRDYGRLLRAGLALGRYDVVLPEAYKSRLPLPARWAGSVLRIGSKTTENTRPGERLAMALQHLGPTYIKLGQFLATRPDVFGVETADDLSRLKDKLPPFPVEEAQAALKAEFEEQADTLFPKLEAPLAAASLAQVHKVMTSDGVRAVKVLRPGVERQMLDELSAMKRAARTIESVDARSWRLEPVAFIETVSAAMEKELDLRLEAGGASEFGEIVEKTGHFRVPKVDWERSGRRILTTDWIDGISLTDAPAIAASGVDRKALAIDVTRGFLSAAIEFGVFHADMHEGNMILSPDGDLWLVDFGIVGRIGLQERRFLAEILLGFIRRDYMRIAQVHFEAGYVPPDRNVGDFAQALRSVGEPIHGKSASEVSMGKLLLQLFDFTHMFGMHLRPELVLLQKTMVQVEGVARGLDPDHDIWGAAQPVVEAFVRRELGPAGVARAAQATLTDMSGRLSRLPDLLDRVETIIEQTARTGVRADAERDRERQRRGRRLPVLLASGTALLAAFAVGAAFF